MNEPTNDKIQSRLDHGSAALWASAMVILALIVVQAGRLGGSEALAREVDDSGALRVLSVDSGNNEDTVVVINDRSETISIYGVLNARSVELFDVQRLPEVFDQAARGAGAGPRR